MDPTASKDRWNTIESPWNWLTIIKHWRWIRSKSALRSMFNQHQSSVSNLSFMSNVSYRSTYPWAIFFVFFLCFFWTFVGDGDDHLDDGAKGSVSWFYPVGEQNCFGTQISLGSPWWFVDVESRYLYIAIVHGLYRWISDGCFPTYTYIYTLYIYIHF